MHASGARHGSGASHRAVASRSVSAADDAAARVRRLAWRVEEDGSLAGTFRLPPLQGAVLLKPLRAAAGDLEHPHDQEDRDRAAGVSAETPAAGEPVVATSSSLADSLLVIAEAFLAGKVAGADDAKVYQVLVHVGAEPVPGNPADPARCHVEDGPAISVSTAQMLACTAALSWMAAAPTWTT